MRVEYSEDVRKQLSKLDNTIKKRILDYMDEVEKLDNPRSRGKRLVGILRGLWRYRVGDYRILCKIKDDVLEILVVEIGHRRAVYDDN
ncbi:MAG: type II toxin-antitoxin system RelE/ParE family toxin [Treponema sp.]|nr:type II toxin-antitoxin system RelE/ParE family toxin [Treponema sp.]